MFEQIARRLPWSFTWRAIRMLLRAQGIGAGADLATSGELAVFKLISSERPVLFDVGGHVGAYSHAFRARFPKAEVYLFEPSAAHMALAKAALQGGVHCFQLALSDRAGVATLYKDAEVTGLASLSKRDLAHRNLSMDLVEEVPCETLDNLLASEKIEWIDLLKIDVEGHELDVLKGARGAFEAGRIGLVQFEFGGCNLDSRTTLRDFFRFFDELGYGLHLVRPAGDLVRLPRYDEAHEQYQTTNYVAAPLAPGTRPR